MTKIPLASAKAPECLSNCKNCWRRRYPHYLQSEHGIEDAESSEKNRANFACFGDKAARFSADFPQRCMAVCQNFDIDQTRHTFCCSTASQTPQR